MKNVIVSNLQVKKDLTLLFVFIFIVLIANVGAIVIYNLAFKELITSMPYILPFVVLLYLVWCALSVFLYFVFKAYWKRRN